MSTREPGQLLWSTIEPYWNELGDSWNRGVEEFLSRMNRAPIKVRHLYAAHWCESEVCNGGFHQFFHNSTGILAPNAAEGFAAVGAGELSSIVTEAMRFFGPEYPRDRHRRLELLPKPDARDRDRGDPFVALDDRFYGWLALGKHRWELMADAYATGD